MTNLKQSSIRTIFFVLMLVIFCLNTILFKRDTPHNVIQHKQLLPKNILPTVKKEYIKVVTNASHVEKVLEGCGEICNHNIIGTESLYFNHIKKNVDCFGLWMNEAIDATMTADQPPNFIPDELMNAFTYDRKVSVRPYGQIFNQRYLGGNALSSNWNVNQIEEWKQLCMSGNLHGTYGHDETRFMKMGLDQMNLSGANVLVVGSEIPWVEACVLGVGANSVTTLEYGQITTDHPQVKTLTPNDFRKQYNDLIESFDAVVTFSSVEHSGLGRYGDAMNPWGDLQAMARAWCASKPGAKLLIAVMTGDDAIEYNAHRIYGKIMYPHLVANWKQLWRAPGGAQVVHVLQKPEQELLDLWVGASLIGRLGNQLFIIASSYGISRTRQYKWCIDSDLNTLETLVEWKVKPDACQRTNVDWKYISEDGYFSTYLPKMVHEFPTQNVKVSSYLQSYRYFANFSLPFTLKNRKWAKQWCQDYGIQVGIHVRRGDFLQSSKYSGLVPSIEYFKAALLLAEKNLKSKNIGVYKIFVASDDIPWIKSQEFFQDSKFVISHFQNEYFHDLNILSQCENLIITCGTFGWWAMNMHSGNGAKIYYAKPFFDFTPQDPYQIFEDHYPSSWHGLDDNAISLIVNK